MNIKTKRIAILLGDPTGIGPELIIKVLATLTSHPIIQYVLVGDKRILEQAFKIVKIHISIPHIKDIEENISQDDVVFYDYSTIANDEYEVGTMNIKGGLSVVATLNYTIELAKKGLVHGILFAPFNKQAMHEAGLPFESELEYFKDTFSIPTIPGELNIVGDLWTMRVTSHVPLKQVSSLLSIDAIVYAIEFLNTQLVIAGRIGAKIAVSGLNPHNGENGLFGTEEQEYISPAIQKAKEKQINVFGPFPSDTLFLRLEKEKIDAIVCMYHDQAQIGLKLLGFEKGMTLHAGLPIPIGTPAHGTAFDIAGKNIASSSACEHALSVITSIVEKKNE